VRPREAIELLKNMKWSITTKFNAVNNSTKALDMAIAALEKQIPKKVRITTSTKRCSVCGRQLSGIGNIHPERNYCQRCGQAIDWEEEA
jgi:hypothetical protein